MADTKPTTKKAAPRKRTVAKKVTPETSPVATEKMSMNPFKIEVISKKTKRLLIAAVIILLLGVILFVNRSLFMAALVNGQPVSRLEIVNELETQYGAGVLNRLIDKSLLLQEAQKRNVTATDEDIAAKRKEIIQQVSGGNEENFKQVLEAQGLTDEEFSKELKIQILAEKMLGDEVKVTDEEINNFIKSNPDLAEGAQNQEEARKQIGEQLKQQKLQTQYASFIEKLRTEANIVRLVNY